MNRKNREENRRPWISTTGEKIRFALGDVGCNLIWGCVGSYLTLYYTDNVLMSAAVAGNIMMIARLLDGLSDIIMGFIIEKTKTKWGKARPWLLWMCLPLMITFLMTFHVPSALSGNAKVAYVAITYTLMCAVTYTAINMAYITLFTLFAPDSNDRNVATTFRTLFAMLTALVVGMVGMPMLNAMGGVKSQAAWDKMTFIFSILSLICIMITFFGVKEKKLTAEDVAEVSGWEVESKEKKEYMSLKEVFKNLSKSKYFYIAALLSVAYYFGNSTGGINVFYARDILGDENLVGMIGLVSLPTMILGAVLAPILYNKFGKRRIMVLGSCVTIASTAIQLIDPYNMLLFFIMYAIKGIGTMLFGAGIGTLPGDVADWSEWKVGERAEGIVTSLSSFGCKVGSGVGGALVGWLLALGKYDGAAGVQVQSALNSEIAMMIGVPMVLGFIQILLLFVWDMEKKRPIIMKELEERRSMKSR
jgi:GPH family glycoside/pentoside/hexuronide:cation symporter